MLVCAAVLIEEEAYDCKRQRWRAMQWYAVGMATVERCSYERSAGKPRDLVRLGARSGPGGQRKQRAVAVTRNGLFVQNCESPRRTLYPYGPSLLGLSEIITRVYRWYRAEIL